MRNHASDGTDYREPYRYSNETRILATNAIRTRYTLLPFFYTLFYEHEQTGIPVMRPMLSQYPLDKNVFKLDTQYMLGDKLLVRPVVEPQTTWVIVRFPSTDGAGSGEIWYDFDDYTKYDVVGTQAIAVGEDKIAVFQRGGTIIPKKLTQRSSSVLMREDPLTLYVAVDKNLKAMGQVYIDDETSFAYKNGVYQLINFSFENDTLKVTENKQTATTINSTIDKVYFAGLTEIPSSATHVCKLNDVETKVTVTKESDVLCSVDIKTVPSCEMSWELELNGSIRTILSSGLIIFVGIFHLIKNCFQIYFDFK